MSCLVKLYTQAFYTGVANGGPQSIANYRIARAKADTFGSLAAIALKRYLEDCPHDADSVQIDIVLDDQYFRLHAEDSLDLLEKGEATHVVLTLPPRLSRSARASSVSRAASVTRAAPARATTPHFKNQRRRSSTVQPVPILLSDSGGEDNAAAAAKSKPAALGKRKRALSTDRVVSRGKSSPHVQVGPAPAACVTLSDDSTSEEIIAAPVPKRATAKSRRSASIGPKTLKGRAQVLIDAEVLSTSSDADEDADDEATQRPETRGCPAIKRHARQEDGTELSAPNKDAALEVMRQNRSAELTGTKAKTSKAVQKTLPKPKAASKADPYEVPSFDEDLEIKPERTTPRKAKPRAPVVSATPTQRPASTRVGSGGASTRPPSSKPRTPAVIPSDAKIISIADTSVSDEAGNSDVPSVRQLTPGSRQATGSGDRGLETRKPLPATEKKNGKRPMQHRVNEHIRFVSPAAGPGHAGEGRSEKPPVAPRFSVANSRGVFPLYPKKGSQPENTPEASERPSVLLTGASSLKSPHTRKATRPPPSSAPAKISASKSRAATPPDTIELIGRFIEKRDRAEKEHEAEERQKELKKASAMVKPKSMSPKEVIDLLVGKPRAKLAHKKKSKPPPASFLKEPENPDEDMSEIINPPAGLQGTRERDDGFATDSASGSPMSTQRSTPPTTTFTPINKPVVTFTPSFRKLKCSGADFKPMNTLNRKPTKPQSPPSASSSKFSNYPPNFQKAFSDLESSDNESSDKEREAESDSEASVTSLGSQGELRYHVEELADDGLPKAFKAWQDKYGSTFRHDEDLPYLYIDEGPWEGLIVDGKHSGKYIGGCRPPSADLIADMAEKTAPRFPELSEAADTSLGEEEDDGGDEGDFAEVTLPPTDAARQATPPSSWSDEAHIREQFERECPPSNQELGMLMSSSPLRKIILERQAPLVAQTPSQRTRSKVMDWEEELNVTPDTERAMSQVETPQTKSRASAPKNAKIVVEIAEPSEAQRAEYQKMPELNARVLASAPRSLGDINANSEHVATASQESGLAVVDYVVNESPSWLKTVDLADFQTDTTAGKRRSSMRKLAAETPSRPSTQVPTSSPSKRKGPLHDAYAQAETRLLGLPSSLISEGLGPLNADSPRKALKSHAQDSPSKHLTPSSTRQSAADPSQEKEARKEEERHKAQRKREKRQRYRARKREKKPAAKGPPGGVASSGTGAAAPSEKQRKKAGRSLATPPNSSRPSSAGPAA